MHEEVPQYHVHDELATIKNRLDAGKDLHIHDTREDSLHKVTDVCAAGVIIEGEGDTRVSRYRGQNHLKSDRYEMVQE